MTGLTSLNAWLRENLTGHPAVQAVGQLSEPAEFERLE
jgi:hypothetical protein